jgi:hypothetical protein
MLDHFTKPILNFVNNLTIFLINIVLIFSVFSLIYNGIKIIIYKKDYADFKKASLYIILAIILIGIIFLDKNKIFESIEGLIKPILK